MICDIDMRPSPWRLHLHRGSVGVGRAGSWQIAAVDGEAPKSSEVAQPAVADDDGDGDGRHCVFCVRFVVFNRFDICNNRGSTSLGVDLYSSDR